MHHYSLHRPVQAQCSCCELTKTFTFRSVSDHVICAGCIRHQGDNKTTLTRRDRDHLGMWKAELALTNDDHASTLAAEAARHAEARALAERLSVELADVRTALTEHITTRPMPQVAQWFENQEITEAYRQRDAAFRLRDTAFQVIWELDEHHHVRQDGDRQCSCGRAIRSCGELAALDRVSEQLDRWERQQIERMNAGKEHSLPSSHPDAIERLSRYGRYEWRG